MSSPPVEEAADTHPPDLNIAAAPPVWSQRPVLKAQAAAEPPAASLRGARDFWLVWSGQSVSLLGDGLYGIAMAWWITQTLSSATALAGYALVWFVPAVTMPLIAGTLVDRANRKALIVLMDGAQGLTVTALAALLGTGTLQLWEV